MIEFALVVWLVIAPLFFGLAWGGLTLGRALQATQINRDAGHMYAKGIDFTLKKNQQLLERLAIGMNFDRTGGGDGVIIFSQILHVDPATCAPSPPAPVCVNSDLNVFVHRVVAGNSGLRSSNYGTPGTVNPDGSVPAYTTTTSA
ncbi:MAG: hypothetical protein ACRD8O_00520, partial [Bryobacteraceae bacterium]